MFYISCLLSFALEISGTFSMTHNTSALRCYKSFRTCGSKLKKNAMEKLGSFPLRLKLQYCPPRDDAQLFLQRTFLLQSFKKCIFSYQYSKKKKISFFPKRMVAIPKKNSPKGYIDLSLVSN